MHYKPLLGREFPRFSGLKSFFRLPFEPKPHAPFDVALLGIPYDGAVSYRPGARFAPTKVREMTSLGRGYHWTRGVNFLKHLEVVDHGDSPTSPVDQARTLKQIEHFISALLTASPAPPHFSVRKFVAIGGDHSTTLGVLRALHKVHGPLRLLHFDAHLDTYPAAWGCPYHHGTFLRHAVDEGLVLAKSSWQFGIRGPLTAPADLDFVKQHGIHTSTVDDLRSKGLQDFLRELPRFSDPQPTYVSFDIDCLDPAFAPATGTPVPGGLSTYEVQSVLRHFDVPNLVGADIVELSPPYDGPGEISALAAADVLFEILCAMARPKEHAP